MPHMPYRPWSWACMHAAASGSTTLLTDADNTAVTPSGQRVGGNVLDNASVPPGSKATVVSFSVAGSNQALSPSSGPDIVTDPTTGKAAGTLALQPDGTFTFTPVLSFSGPVPLVSLNIRSSDGQTVTSSLSIIVQPGEGATAGAYTCMCAAHAHRCYAADVCTVDGLIPAYLHAGPEQSTTSAVRVSSVQ